MHKAQTTVPATAIKNQSFKVNVQSLDSAASGITYDASALPTYVQQLRSPDIKETFDPFARRGGTMQIKSRLTPCIHPVRKAESPTDTTGFASENI